MSLNAEKKTRGLDAVIFAVAVLFLGLILFAWYLADHTEREKASAADRGEIFQSAAQLGEIAPYVQTILTSVPAASELEILASDNPESALRKWLDHTEGNSAFARGSGHSFGWVRNRNTMQTAQEDALAYCSRKGRDCKIIARAASVMRHDAFEDLVAPSVIRHYNIYAKKQGHKAFAITDGATIGYVWNKQSEAIARLSAQQKCAEFKKGRSSVLPDRPCRVVLSE